MPPPRTSAEEVYDCESEATRCESESPFEQQRKARHEDKPIRTEAAIREQQEQKERAEADASMRSRKAKQQQQWEEELKRELEYQQSMGTR